MAKENDALKNVGYTLSGLGGLLVILNLTTWKDRDWTLESSALAVFTILIGIYLIRKAEGGNSKDDDK